MHGRRDRRPAFARGAMPHRRRRRGRGGWEGSTRGRRWQREKKQRARESVTYLGRLTHVWRGRRACERARCDRMMLATMLAGEVRRGGGGCRYCCGLRRHETQRTARCRAECAGWRRWSPGCSGLWWQQLGAVRGAVQWCCVRACGMQQLLGVCSTGRRGCKARQDVCSSWWQAGADDAHTLQQ